jgi:hypothetical protein
MPNPACFVQNAGAHSPAEEYTAAVYAAYNMLLMFNCGWSMQGLAECVQVGDMSPPLPDASMIGCRVVCSNHVGSENHGIAMHKAASDKVPLALLVPAAALALAASHPHGTVPQRCWKGGLCIFKVVTTLDPCWEVSKLTAATTNLADAHKVKKLGGRGMSVKHM